MLSFTFRRVLSHPGIFSRAQRLPTRVISTNRSVAITVQRNLTTTASNRNSDSTADSKPESESKPKSTRRKTGSSPKTAGKDQKKEKKKAVTKPKKPKKVTVNQKALPPKAPGSGYTQWMRDWVSTQPKIENLEVAQDTMKRGAQTWNALPEHEKQQYREKADALRDEYNGRIEEWRDKVDLVVLRELNRRRVAKGLPRIRGPRRPPNGYIRFFNRVRDDYPRAGKDYRIHFRVAAEQASSQWRAMSDAEKAEYNDPAKADLAAWHAKYGAGSQAKA